MTGYVVAAVLLLTAGAWLGMSILVAFGMARTIRLRDRRK